MFSDQSDEIINWLWPQIEKIYGNKDSGANTKDPAAHTSKVLVEDIIKDNQLSSESNAKEKKADSGEPSKRKNSGVYNAALDGIKEERKRVKYNIYY